MKLHYEFGQDAVTVTMWEGDKYAEGEIHDTVDFPYSAIHAENRDRIFGYGFAKWLQDRTSQVKGAAEKLAEMQSYAAILREPGAWAKARKGGGGAGGNALLAAALAEVFKAPLAAVLKRLSQMTADERKAIAAREDVAAALAKLREEADADLGF